MKIMKTLMLSALTVCIGLVFSAFATGDTSCAFNLNGNLTLSAQLYQALPDGVWVGAAKGGKEAVLQFHASGKADWFTYGRNGLSDYREFTWSVQSLGDDEARLELSDRDGRRQLSFEVEPACQGMTLTENGKGIFLSLEHETPTSIAEYRQKENLLAGKWENTTYPFDLKSMEGAYLKYAFYKSGKFERMLGCADRNIKESGQWWLAKDGQHLVMRLDDGQTTVAEVKYLEMDELVLQHVLACDDKDFNTGEKDFFFNRQ